MSFILDALKKSESDRQRQTAPALFEVKVAAPRRRFPWWAWALGGLFAVNFFVLLWVLVRPGSGSAETASLASPAATAPMASSTPAPPPGMVTVPATVTIPTTVNIPVNAAPSITMSSAPEAGVVAPSQTPPLAEEPLLSAREPSVPPDYDANDYRPAITAAQANDAAQRRAGGPPSLDEVVAQGAQVPELRLDLHVYAENPADRFVFINMRKLREGDSLPDGVHVDRITQRGAELSFRGQRFTLEGN